jgi:iron complex transport system substrate-binding protein
LRTTRTAAAILLGVALTACGGASATDTAGTTSAAAQSGVTDAFPVTVEHAFGETTLEQAPTRVATVSWVNADVSIALGVVPVGMPRDEWGGNEQGSTPWKDAALEQAGAPIGTDGAPAQYAETDGIDVNAIAALAPDVILGAYSGLTQEEYDKLSKIAPVVAYPDTAYGTAWQDSTRMIGKALGRSDAAEDLVEQTERTVADEVAEHPALEGTTFIYGNLEPASGAGVNVYTASDNRPRFLTSLGMEQAEVVDANTEDDGSFFFEWSPERADELESDVFGTWVPEARTVEQIEADPLLSQIPAVQDGTLVADSDNTLTLSISAASPLSLPWALEQFLPKLAAAAEKAA